MATAGAAASRVTEGGLLAAATVVLAWLSAYVPVLPMVLPAPATILIYRHGLGAGLTAWVVAVVLVGVLLGNVPGAALLALAGFISAGLGVALRRGWAPGHVMSAATAAALAWLVLTLAGGMRLLGVNAVDALFKAVEEGMSSAIGLYRRLGTPAEQLEQWQRQISSSLELLRVATPAVFLMSAITAAFANYWVVRTVLTRLGEKLPWFAPFSRWRSSRVPALALLASAGLWAASPSLPFAGAVAANLFTLGMAVALVQGLSVAWFWLERQQAARLLKALLIVAVYALWPVRLALLLFGATDGWFNWRNL